MELGPKTTPPSEPVEKLLDSSASQGVKHFLIATSHGVLLGTLARTDAEKALEETEREPDSAAG